MVSITMATALLFVFALLGSVSAEKPTPKPKPFEKHPCFVEPKPGPCLARFHRYFWNQETNVSFTNHFSFIISFIISLLAHDSNQNFEYYV